MPEYLVAPLTLYTANPSRKLCSCLSLILPACHRSACLLQRIAQYSPQPVAALRTSSRGLTSIVPRLHAIEVEDQPGGSTLDRARLLAAAGSALREVALHAAADARARLALQHLPQLLAAQQSACRSGRHIALKAPSERHAAAAVGSAQVFSISSEQSTYHVTPQVSVPQKVGPLQQRCL